MTVALSYKVLIRTQLIFSSSFIAYEKSFKIKNLFSILEKVSFFWVFTNEIKKCLGFFSLKVCINFHNPSENFHTDSNAISLFWKLGLLPKWL